MRKTFLCALLVILVGLFAGNALATPGDYHQGLGDDTLTSEPRDIAGDIEPDRVPLAAPSQRGCVTDLISINFSSRGGVKPDLLVAHYTVSRNSSGWGDVNAIRGWFSQARAQASSNYIIDFEGNCKLIVPETAKAWTQGAFNPRSISIEFIAMGDEGQMSVAALRKGARVFADAAKRWGIPIRLVNPVGCGGPTGVTDHLRLECGNTHTDIAPFSMTRFVNFIKDAAAPPPPPPKRIRFSLRGPRGGIVAVSTSTLEGENREEDKLRIFLRNQSPRLAKFLQERRATIIREVLP